MPGFLCPVIQRTLDDLEGTPLPTMAWKPSGDFKQAIDVIALPILEVCKTKRLGMYIADEWASGPIQYPSNGYFLCNLDYQLMITVSEDDLFFVSDATDEKYEAFEKSIIDFANLRIQQAKSDYLLVQSGVMTWEEIEKMENDFHKMGAKH